MNPLPQLQEPARFLVAFTSEQVCAMDFDGRIHLAETNGKRARRQIIHSARRKLFEGAKAESFGFEQQREDLIAADTNVLLPLLFDAAGLLRPLPYPRILEKVPLLVDDQTPTR